MSELAAYTPPPTQVTTTTTTDPTGGRLVAWAEAASAANQLARALSQTAFVPKEMTNVGNATAAILAGDEVGLSPLAALRSIYVVHGTPAFYARTMVALALSSGHEIWTEESTDSKVTVKGRRRGSDHTETATWTIQRAQQAGYTKNSKYSTNAQEMLYSKAAAEVARKVAADVLAGMARSVEDLELEDAPTTTVTRSAGTTKVSRKPKAPEPAQQPQEPAEPTDTPLVDSLAEQGDDKPSEKQMGLMFALLGEAGLKEKAPALRYVGSVIDREIESRSDLTASEVSRVVDALQAEAQPTDLSGAPEADDAAYDWAGDES